MGALRFAGMVLGCGVLAFGVGACGEDEPITEQVCVEVESVRAARGNPKCTDARCMVKRTRQPFTAALCSVSLEDAVQRASQDQAWRAVALKEVERACRGFACPDPNPCTIEGRRCNVQPARARFDGRGDPVCEDTGETRDCEEGETLWHCTRLADVQGGRVCGCLDAGQDAGDG